MRFTSVFHQMVYYKRMKKLKYRTIRRKKQGLEVSHKVIWLESASHNWEHGVLPAKRGTTLLRLLEQFLHHLWQPLQQVRKGPGRSTLGKWIFLSSPIKFLHQRFIELFPKYVHDTVQRVTYLYRFNTRIDTILASTGNVFDVRPMRKLVTKSRWVRDGGIYSTTPHCILSKAPFFPVRLKFPLRFRTNSKDVYRIFVNESFA